MKIKLEDWQWEMVEAMARAEGVSVETILHDLLAEGIQHEKEFGVLKDDAPVKGLH